MKEFDIQKILSDIDKMYLDDEYISYISDLIENDAVKSMKNFIQHGTTTTLEHCLKV